jgi:hypothetical protein
MYKWILSNLSIVCISFSKRHISQIFSHRKVVHQAVDKEFKFLRSTPHAAPKMLLDVTKVLFEILMRVRTLSRSALSIWKHEYFGDQCIKIRRLNNLSRL